MNLGIKPGVKILGLSNQAILGFIICAGVYEDFGLGECIMTSATDGSHSRESLHYAGQAFDLRTRHVEQAKLQPAKTELQRRLGDDFDVILEGDHFHIEYQPKKGIA